MFLCTQTGKRGAQTSASTHFLAKKVSALCSSWQSAISEGEYFTFQPALLFAASASCLLITRPGQGLERERRAFKRPHQKPKLRPGAVPPVFPYKRKLVVRPSPDCNIPNFDSNHSDTFFSVLVFLQSRHKQIPKKHHINTVSTSHISHTHITFTRNAADHNITQSALTRRHLSQSIVRAGKMLSITILPP